MPRVPRRVPGDAFYHVLNRANARARIFGKQADYEAFERVLLESIERHAMRVLSYCVMPNHWHLVLWPRRDGDLSRFMQGLTLTHTQRWHAHRKSVGTGHLYQGRYKSFPIQGGQNLMRVLRYVGRNPVRAKLVDQGQNWRWGSLWHRVHENEASADWLQRWPGGEPADWLDRVNAKGESEEELQALRESTNRGRPFGSPQWQKTKAQLLNLDSTLRPRGRPRKSEDEAST